MNKETDDKIVAEVLCHEAKAEDSEETKENPSGVEVVATMEED